MPVQKCARKGKPGHKWGNEGFCYVGANSEELALRQGKAIKTAQSKRDAYYKDLMGVPNE